VKKKFIQFGGPERGGMPWNNWDYG